MRIDYQNTTHKTAGRKASGFGAHSIWTLTGVALLAACAHDGSSFVGVESGGGGGDGATDGQTTLLAAGAVAAVAIIAGNSDSGGSSTGSGNQGVNPGGGNPAPAQPAQQFSASEASYSVSDGEYAEASHSDYGAPVPQGGAPTQRSFTVSNAPTAPSSGVNIREYMRKTP